MYVISLCIWSPNVLSNNYSFNSVVLNRVIRDLGVLLDSKLLFNRHIERTINRANSLLVIICAMANYVHDPICIKALLCALVRPILQYASIVWCPVSLVWIERIESSAAKCHECHGIFTNENNEHIRGSLMLIADSQ